MLSFQGIIWLAGRIEASETLGKWFEGVVVKNWCMGLLALVCNNEMGADTLSRLFLARLGDGRTSSENYTSTSDIRRHHYLVNNFHSPPLLLLYNLRQFSQWLMIRGNHNLQERLLKARPRLGHENPQISCPAERPIPLAARQ